MLGKVLEKLAPPVVPPGLADGGVVCVCLGRRFVFKMGPFHEFYCEPQCGGHVALCDTMPCDAML